VWTEKSFVLTSSDFADTIDFIQTDYEAEDQEASMAIKEQTGQKKGRKAEALPVDTPQRKGPYILTPEESEHLLSSLTTPPAPLSPEMKRAIKNYKRLKAEKIP
jgi:hypothetical protein